MSNGILTACLCGDMQTKCKTHRLIKGFRQRFLRGRDSELAPAASRIGGANISGATTTTTFINGINLKQTGVNLKQTGVSSSIGRGLLKISTFCFLMRLISTHAYKVAPRVTVNRHRPVQYPAATNIKALGDYSVSEFPAETLKR